MAEIVNLRQARKRRQRAIAEAAAADNRAVHGRTRAQRLGDDAERARQARLLDGARLDSAKLDGED